MLHDLAGHKTVVNRLEIRGNGLDPVLTGQRLDFLLRQTGLHPSGLSPSAILCVRRLRDPLPGTLRLEHPGELPPAGWEKALSDRLTQLARQAVRPARDQAGANVEAVIFDNRAELLACLAADWRAGRLRANWWWQSLFGHMPLPALQIVQAWQDAPEYVPAALQMLAAQRLAVAFLRQWETSSVQLLLSRLIQRFALSELNMALSFGLPDEPTQIKSASPSNPLPSETGSTGLQLQPAPSEKSSVPVKTEAPALSLWQAVVPESADPDLTPAQAQLLAVGLMLYRVPEKLRAPAMARALAAWVNSASVVVSVETPAPETTSVAAFEALPPVNAPVAPAPAALPTRANPPVRPPKVAPFSPAAPPDQNSVQAPDKANPKLKFNHKNPSQSAPEVPATAETRSGLPDNFFEPMALPSLVIDTQYAGLFYLINLGLFLELYGDFTSPARPGLSLPIWDFLALPGENFLGQRLHRDPIWELLAQLAGRSTHEKPWQNFEAPESWRVPCDWLKPFPARTFSWWVSEGRLRVRHPAGFLVLDLPLEAGISPEQQLTTELAPYPQVQLRKRSFKFSAALGLDQWLGWVMPYVKARLGRALGATPGKAGPILVRQPGRVSLDAMHLTVHLSLAHLPLAVRFAGLDRDPGWVPAAGRYIAFIFD